MTDNSNLVYSTDPELNQKCPRCKKLIPNCVCKKPLVNIDSTKIKASLRLERKQRGGKDVTVIEHLPCSEEFLRQLSGELKKKCGSGGTYKLLDTNGIIEIQGDKREQVKLELLKQGIQCK